MAIDFYAVGDSLKESRWLASMDEVAHSELFYSQVLRTDECPLLWQMVDFYCNVWYTGSELDQLESEVERLFGRTSPLLSETLQKIADAAKTAKSTGSELNAVGD